MDALKKNCINKRTLIVASLLLLPGLSSARSADFKKEISEVKSGVRTEARAIWWGFNPEDATKSLQDAINSGAKKIVVDNPGKPWIVGPLKLASNQEIVFAEDVQVTLLTAVKIWQQMILKVWSHQLQLCPAGFCHENIWPGY